MRGRAPLLCRLGIGPLRVDSEEAEQSWEPAELDRGTAERALAEARALAVRDERSFTERQNAMHAKRPCVGCAHEPAGSRRSQRFRGRGRPVAPIEYAYDRPRTLPT